MDYALFFAALYFASLVLGLALERLRVPWIFAALIFGLVLAWNNPFTAATESEPFIFLGELGLHLFLVVIGMTMDIDEILKRGRFLIRVATAIVIAELIAGGIFIHYAFGTSWLIAAIVAFTFATVGEAFLLPILEQLKMVRTKLGQAILGIGVIDNAFEILAVVAISILIGLRGGPGGVELTSATIAFGGLAAVTAAIWLFPVHLHLRAWLRSTEMVEEVLFAGVIMVAALFIWLGSFAHAGALGALLAGLCIQKLVPQESFDELRSHFKVAVYAFFGPILFAWVGVTADIQFLASAPLLVVAQMAVVKAAKISATYASARSEFGGRRAMFAGVALSVKFSTSLVLVKLLYERGLIAQDLYSVLVASKIGFKFVVPFLLSWMASAWNLETEDDEKEAVGSKAAREKQG